MITRRTKVQLVIFVIITLVGVSFVGARYARLDRLFYDDAYTVVAHFTDSGGAFVGAEVSYRGVQIGKVNKMVVTDAGVDIHLDIENGFDEIPAEARAVVGNRSAVGEQYVELQPKVNEGPYLENDSEIPIDDTSIPISTDKLLTDLSTTAASVDQESLRTVITELGLAFDGTGENLQQIIDTGNSFIGTANDNFDVTTSLIKNGNTVLRGQVESETAIRTFARDLSLFSGTLAGSDKDLRTIIDSGSATANQLRTFLEDNEVDLGQLLNNLVTTGEIVVKRLPGIEHMLVVYPYVVEGGSTVVAKDPKTGLYDAHFGLVLTEGSPVCHRGYEATDRRPPQNGENRPMTTSVRCAEPATTTNSRGGQHAPRTGAAYRAPVATYDPDSGELVWGDGVDPSLQSRETLAPRALAEDSWKWLFLHPLTQGQDR